MKYRVKFACAMQAIDEAGNAFVIARKREPNEKIAIVRREEDPTHRGNSVWSVETLDGDPVLGSKRFGCRQRAYQKFLADCGAFARRVVVSSTSAVAAH